MSKPYALLLATAFLSASCAAPPTATEARSDPPQAAPTTLTATAPPVYPVRDFFRNAPRAFFRISGDGRTLAFMQPTGPAERRNIFVQPLAGTSPQGEPRQLTFETARDIDNYAWKGAATLVYQKDYGGDENFHVVAVDAASGRVTDLTPYPGVKADVLDDLKDDPDHILVSHNRRDAKVFDVYRVDVRSGASVRLAENPGDVGSWLTDHAGNLRIAVASVGLQTELRYRDGAEGAFRTLVSTDFRTDVAPQFFTADGRRFYALSNRGRDRQALVIIDPARPDAEEMVYEHPEVDLDAARWSHRRKTLTRVDYQTAKPERRCFDAAERELFRRLEARLPGYDLNLQSATLAEDKFVVAAVGDRTPGTRYLYDAAADTLTKLADINPRIRESDMAPVRPVTYTARDGLQIPAYLTLPVGRPARPLPCIVNPHGGPWARDAWGYNPEVQFLANRGYCVLQMNFRGSTGYGRRYWEASFGQWGRAMQDDVTDGARWLVSQGIADPKRLGIYGGSYGGYATLAGVTFTPDLYAAAVDYVGVSNLFTFMQTIPPYWRIELEKMHAMVGDPVADRARLEATSPALHVDRIKTPLFIAQGARDPRVNKAESDQVVEALKRRGVEVRYMVKEDEGHGFHNEENQFEFYGAMEQFFAEHLKR